MDTNGDGVVDRHEYDAAQQKRALLLEIHRLLVHPKTDIASMRPTSLAQDSMGVFTMVCSLLQQNKAMREVEFVQLLEHVLSRDMQILQDVLHFLQQALDPAAQPAPKTDAAVAPEATKQALCAMLLRARLNPGSLTGPRRALAGGGCEG